jgi:hypothetical protein
MTTVEASLVAELAYQIATPKELDEILAFGEARLAANDPDPTTRMFKSWHAPWRKESLEHYLKLGWSFIVRDKQTNELLGFFLGQALLFMRGHTQTLWIEALDAKTEEARQGLADVAIRLSREKHLQRVLFAETANVQGAIKNFPHAPMQGAITEVATTKS